MFTLLLGREQTNRPYPFIGVPEAHHAISHHQNDPQKLAKAAKINAYHIELLARFALPAARAGRPRLWQAHRVEAR